MSPRADLGCSDLCNSTDEELRKKITDLRKKLALTSSAIESVTAEAALSRFRMEEERVRQAEELSQLHSAVQELGHENKRLQNEVNASWFSTRRMQAALRLSQEQTQEGSQELAEARRRLEQENCRLRREGAGLRSRLLGWQQMQRRTTDGESRMSASGSSSSLCSPDGHSTQRDLGVETAASDTGEELLALGTARTEMALVPGQEAPRLLNPDFKSAAMAPHAGDDKVAELLSTAELQMQRQLAELSDRLEQVRELQRAPRDSARHHVEELTRLAHEATELWSTARIGVRELGLALLDQGRSPTPPPLFCTPTER